MARALIAILLCAPALADDAAATRRVVPFGLAGGVDRIVVEDFDGDGRAEVLVARGARLSLHDLSATAGIGAEARAVLDVPGRATAWSVSAEPSRDARILALSDGRELLEWRLEAGGRSFGAPATLLAGLRGTVPRGVWFLRLLHDVDGDGDGDVLVPALDRYEVWLRGDDGQLERGPALAAAATVDTRLGLDGDLTRRIGQSVVLPSFRMRDVNGDGRPDLVSESADLIEVHLTPPRGDGPAAAAGERPAAFRFDIAAAREKLGELDPDRIDFSNLTGIFAFTAQALLEDLDGDGIADLLVREGPRVTTYLGDANGVRTDKPAQVLRSAGNVIGAFLFDGDGDGRKELWIARIEAVSIGDVFLWLVAGGSIGFEAFVYPAEGRAFARRAARKLTLAVRFPSLVSLAGLGEDIEERLDDAAPESRARIDLDGKGDRRDLLVLRGGRLHAWRDTKDASRQGGVDLLDLLGYRRDRDDYTIDLLDLVDRLLLDQGALIETAGGRAPDLTLEIPGAAGNGGFLVRDLDGDGREDVLLVTTCDDEALRGVVITGL